MLPRRSSRHAFRLSAISVGLLASGVALADAHLDPQLVSLMQKAGAAEELQIVVSYEQSGPVTAAQTAAELGLSPGAIRTGVHRLRHDFRMHLRREVAKTVDSPDQIDEEMRHLRTTLGSEQ